MIDSIHKSVDGEKLIKDYLQRVGKGENQQ
jgi:hypothetical protein